MSFPADLSNPPLKPIAERYSPEMVTNIDTKIRDIARVVFDVFMAVVAGALTAAGIVLVVLGTVGSFGTLPSILLLAATVVSAAAKAGFIFDARQETNPIQPVVPYLSGEYADNCEVSAEKIDPTQSVVPNINDEFKGKCTVMDEKTDPTQPTFLVRNEENPKIFEEVNREKSNYQKGVHPHFIKDYQPEPSSVSIEGQTLLEMFGDEFAKKEELKNLQDSFQKQADHAEDELAQDAFQVLADFAEHDHKICRAELNGKIMEKLISVVTDKLGENSPLLAPISLALCPDMPVMLMGLLNELSDKSYNGQLFQPLNEPIETKLTYQYDLQFPQGAEAAAVIAITAMGQYSFIDPGKGMEPRKLEVPLDFLGNMTISIDHKGKTTITRDVHLSPVDEKIKAHEVSES